MKPELPAAYNPHDHEDAAYRKWEASGFFNPDTLAGTPYAIMMPPPNVTGVLHLGHALENSLMDTMARFQRMRGKKVLLLPGTDHAAIATQAKVEKILMQKGTQNPRKELGREGLLKEIRIFSENSKATILSQIRKMGTSCDWSRLAYTFDEARSAAVNTVFQKMFLDGIIYRDYRVVNWSAKGQSTLSDDEIEYAERAAKLYTFRYDKDFPVPIATTRPETKLGDTAVAVHPDDLRYAPFIGKTYTVNIGTKNPLRIKIIANEAVDKNFGTGAVGVTPAHSAIDFEMYRQQKEKGDPIELIQVIGPDGKMTDKAGDAYQGLSVEEAREKFISRIKQNGLLEKEEEIVHNVGMSDRFGDTVEFLPMTQWFVDMRKEIPGKGKSLRDLARESVATGLNGDPDQKISILPERFEKVFFNWIDKVHDWCISRQIWWGHRIPVWYCKNSKFNPPAGGQNSKLECGEPIVSIEPITKCPYCDGDIEQDPDTLDTWFSSGMWTFSTLGWPQKTSDLETFHPTSWMQMGYEILFLWMVRMILMSAYTLDSIPFREVYIHGILRDENGRKFSKSLGNTLDPLDIIKTHGCDALRLSILIGTSPGNDSRFYQEKVDSARNFVNKLWNIGRYVIQQTTDNRQHPTEDSSSSILHSSFSIPPSASPADHWILYRLAKTVQETTRLIESHQLSLAGETLRDFTWNDFADWYIEAHKVEKNDTVLRFVFETILRLWHPFMPFVTETLWEYLEKDSLLMVEPWPNNEKSLFEKSEETSEAAHEEEVGAFEQYLREPIAEIRAVRAARKIPPSAKPILSIDTFETHGVATPERTKRILEENRELFCRLARLADIRFETAPLAYRQAGNKPDALRVTARHFSGVLALPTGRQVFDEGDDQKENEAEQTMPTGRQERQLAERDRLEAFIKTTAARLEDKNFLAKAPARIIEGARESLALAREKLATLSARGVSE